MLEKIPHLKKIITAGLVFLGGELHAQNFDNWMVVTPEEFKRRKISIENIDIIDMQAGNENSTDNSKQARKFIDKNGKTFYWINTKAVTEDSKGKDVAKDHINNFLKNNPEIKINDFKKEIKELRTERIKNVHSLLELKREEIAENQNKDLFSKSFRSELERKKGGWIAGENRLKQLFSEVDTLPEAMIDTYVNFILNRNYDWHLSHEDQEKLIKEKKGERTFAGYESFKTTNLRKEMFSDLSSPLFQLYNNDYSFLTGNNYSDLNIVDFIDSSNNHQEQNYKEVFKNALQKMHDDFVLKSKKALSFMDEDTIQKSIDLAWENRPLEGLQIELLTLEKELENLEKNLSLEGILSSIHSSKDWLLNNISSKEYLNKLIEGEGLTLPEALKVQSERYNRVYNLPFEINTRWLDVSKYSHKDDFDASYLEFNAYDVARYPESNALHEFEHGATDANTSMTTKAKEIYKSAYIGDEALSKLIYKQENTGAEFGDNFEYFKNPTEMDARKKVLEYEMENLGIKKPNDKMTHEHYLKLLELYKENKLNRNSMQIILMTTEEGLLRIMNEIAFDPKEDFADRA